MWSSSPQYSDQAWQSMWDIAKNRIQCRSWTIMAWNSIWSNISSYIQIWSIIIMHRLIDATNRYRMKFWNSSGISAPYFIKAESSDRSGGLREKSKRCNNKFAKSARKPLNFVRPYRFIDISDRYTKKFWNNGRNNCTFEHSYVKDEKSYRSLTLRNIKAMLLKICKQAIFLTPWISEQNRLVETSFLIALLSEISKEPWER